MSSALVRAQSFCEDYDLSIPILMAPMAGACPVSLATAVANGGGMGACGCLLMEPGDIRSWARQMRAGSNGAFQLNTWIPDPDPVRNLDHEAEVRAFLRAWGPETEINVGDLVTQDFAAQCEAMLAAGPHVISSIMGLYPRAFVDQMHAAGIAWFATVTTLAEARAAQAAGADVLIAQGMEAGGHRGTFEANSAASSLVGLFSLVPAIVDAVDIPVVAAGGIADARGVAAALVLGASAVQIGTGLLRTPEAGTHRAWADAIARTHPEDTVATRAFSGRLGRSVRTAYTDAAQTGPDPAPYPIQRALTQPMRAGATTIDTMQAWAGQSAQLSRDLPAAELVESIWKDARRMLDHPG